MIHRYHDATKHHFQRFARSLGYLDWASQPNPFRSFPGAPSVALNLDPAAPADEAGAVGLIADTLRHSLGLSAWKQFRESRWALRVNPSSGNLHPTEAYVVTGPAAGLSDGPAVYHYAPDRHALERRCAFDAAAWPIGMDERAGDWLIALTSIHWREAWKYGERAFRYCQHDLGHAIAALRLAVGLASWRLTLLPEWSHEEISSLVGIDRDADYVEAEREAPACIMAVTRGDVGEALRSGRGRLVDAARAGHWTGRASQLSEDHVEWTIIDEVARATADPGRPCLPSHSSPDTRASEGGPAYSRALMLQRRSAQAFDGRSAMTRERFIGMLSAVMPGARQPWDALWWDARIHLALFVHRVTDLDPGLYLLPRNPAVLERLRAACGRDFLWEPADDTIPLSCLARGDCRTLAGRLSCDQDIAADGFFSLGMIADFDESLREHGPSFYRHLFWESGVVGLVLYLEAEAAGARATGIGCFYDDPVHDVLGLSGHAFQSLYHFTVGVPVEDSRISTQPAYLP